MTSLHVSTSASFFSDPEPLSSSVFFRAMKRPSRNRRTEWFGLLQRFEAGSMAQRLNEPWFYFKERPQPATERSAVSTLYGAPLVRH